MAEAVDLNLLGNTMERARSD